MIKIKQKLNKYKENNSIKNEQEQNKIIEKKEIKENIQNELKDDDFDLNNKIEVTELEKNHKGSIDIEKSKESINEKLIKDHDNIILDKENKELKIVLFTDKEPRNTFDKEPIINSFKEKMFWKSFVPNRNLGYVNS